MFDDGAEDRTEKAMTWLLCYAATAGTRAAVKAPATKLKEEKPTSTSTCLLCEKSYAQRSSLSRHFQKKHVAGGAFEHPLSCPQCCRDGVEAPPTVSSPEEWCDHAARCHGGRANVPVVGAKAARLNSSSDTPRPTWKPARRKREEEAPAEPSIPGASVLDFSAAEEPVRKKARRDTAESETSDEVVFFEQMPWDSPCFDLASPSDLGSSGSGDGWVSPVSSADTIKTPGLESPVLLNFELTLLVDAAVLDLADLDDGAWLGLDSWNDATWQWPAEPDKGSLETCDAAWEDFIVGMVEG